MKRLTLFLAAACLVACDCNKGAPDAGVVVDAGPKQLTEKEPNDGPEKALLIDSSAIVEGNLGADPARPDEDWYVLRSSLPKTADVQVTCPPGADMVLEVVDDARNVLLQVNAEGPSKPEHLPDLDVSGSVYLRVTGAKKGAGGAYTLTVSMKDRQVGVELEPNDRKVDATHVPLGQAVSGFLSHPQDADWFRFELPTPEGVAPPAEVADSGADADSGAIDSGSAPAPAADAAVDAGPAPEVKRLPLKIELSAVEGVAWDVQVLSEAEATLFSAHSKEGQPLSLRNVGVRETDRVIYVVVKSAWVGAGKDAHRGYNAGTYYTLSVAEEEAGATAEIEPNDTLDRATDLPPGAYREGFISPKGDVDYYGVTADQPSLAKVNVTGVEKLDLVLSAVEPAADGGEKIALKANDGQVKEPEQLNAVSCNPKCWFKVEAAPRKVDGKWVKDDDNPEMSYRISATLVPDDGSQEREPNNTPDTATPIELGKPIRGTVFPKKDTDFFLLDLSNKPVKTPLRATLTGILKVDVGLYVHQLDADGKPSLVQTADSAKGDKPEVVRFTAEPGKYVFEVRDSKNREANFQDSYQLTVEEAE